MTGYEHSCVHMRFSKQRINMIIEQLSNSDEAFTYCCPLGATCPLALALICHVPHKLVSIPSQKNNTNPFLEALMRINLSSQPSVCSHNTPSNKFFTGPGFACSIHGIMDLETTTFRLNETQLNREPVYPMPCNARIWENIFNNNKKKEHKSNLFQFKVLSYNVLSEILLQPNFEPEFYENEESAWRSKSERIYNEVRLLDPDIICFQEVQISHSKFFRQFNDIGYRGVFKKKTNRRYDGCAVLFKDSMFELNERVGVEYCQPKCPVLHTDNVGLLVKLTPRGGSKPLVIASTHLCKSKKHSAQEGYSASRIAQIRILLHETKKFVCNGNEHLPVILTGDFNSTRHSEAIKLLVDGQIIIPIEHSLQHLGLKESFLKQYYNEGDYDGLHAPPPQFKKVNNPFRFVSVYHLNRRESQQLQGWVAIDYMFYTEGPLRAVQRLRPPPIRQKENGLLNIHTDHMALAVVFEMKTC